MEVAVQVFSNPANDLINVVVEKPQAYSIRIVDLSGKTVLFISLPNSGVIDISSLKEGLYMIYISDGKTEVARKVVKE